MGNLHDRLISGTNQVTGGLLGANLLEQLKADMVKQNVFQKLFGAKGERIFIHEQPSWNEKITPGIEMWWESESQLSQNSLQTGIIGGHLVLPSRIDTKSNPNFPRLLSATLMRWMASKTSTIFQNVLGLTEFGRNATFDYSTMLVADGFTAPRIAFRFPFKFDLQLLRIQNPGVDFDGNLDEELFGTLQAIGFKITDDNINVQTGHGTVLLESTLNG